MANGMDFLIRIVANLSNFTEGMEQARKEAKATADAIGASGTGGTGMSGLSPEEAYWAEQMGQAAEKATPDVTAMGGALEDTAKSAEKVNTEGERMGRGASVGGAWGLQIAGMMLQSMANQVFGFGSSAVQAGADFQSAMELMHTQAGATQEQVNALSGAVLGLAGSVATSPDVLAQGLYHLVSAAGVTAHTMDDLKIAAEGAKLGGADLESVTNALNATMVSGISGIDNASTAMGVLNATVGAGDMHMQDLADALGTGVMASIKGFGVTAQEAAAALATFGDNNIRGAEAGTELRMSVEAIAKPVRGGEDALRSIGLTANDLTQTLSKQGLNAALKLLSDHMQKAGVTGDEAGALLTNAFGRKAGVGIQVLEEQYSRFSGKLQEITDKGNSFTQDWQAYTQTLSYQTGVFTARVQSLDTQLGLAFGPAVANLIKNVLTPLLNGVSGLATWFSHLSPATQQWIVYMAAASGVVAALGGALLIFVGTLGMAAEGLAMFGISADAALGPVGLVILGIMALIAVGTLLITHWQQVRTWLQATFGAPFAAVMHAAQAVFAAVHEAFRNTVGAAWGYIAPYLRAVLGEIGGFFSSHWGEIKQIVDAAWKFIRATVTLGADVLGPFLSSVLKGLEDVWRLAWDGIRDALKLAWDAISGIFKAALDVFLAILGPILDILTGHWHKAWDDFKTYLGKALNDAWAMVKNVFGDFGKLFYDFGANMIHMMADGIRGAITDVVDAVKNVANTVKQWLGFHSPTEQGPGAEADQWAPNFMRMYTRGILDGIPALQAALGQAFDAPVLAALGPGVRSMLNGTIQHVVSGGVTHTHMGQVDVGGSVQRVSQQQYDQLRRQMPGYGHG